MMSLDTKAGFTHTVHRSDVYNDVLKMYEERFVLGEL